MSKEHTINVFMRPSRIQFIGLSLLVVTLVDMNFGQFHFYNSWFEVFRLCIDPILLLLWMWLIWRIARGRRVVAVLKWACELLLFWFLAAATQEFWLTYQYALNGHELNDRHYEGFDVIDVSVKPGPAGTIIRQVCQESQVPLVGDMNYYIITLRTPIVDNFIYSEADLWSGDAYPNNAVLANIARQIGSPSSKPGSNCR